MSATAVGERETQRRSYPGIRGQYGTRGWELVRELDLAGNALRIAGEARALPTAPLCPALDATDLILGSEQMALQIHESVGHAVELDRILGWEAAFAGTSWLDPAQIGHTGHPGGAGPVPGRARRGQGVSEMDAKATSTDPLATAERVLDLVRDRASDAEAEVTVRRGTDAVGTAFRKPGRIRADRRPSSGATTQPGMTLGRRGPHETGAPSGA